jgi:hypothetical protein
LHQSGENLARADGILFGRVAYELMEAVRRPWLPPLLTSPHKGGEGPIRFYSRRGRLAAARDRGGKFWFGSLPLGGEGRGGGVFWGSVHFKARAIVPTAPWILSSSS